MHTKYNIAQIISTANTLIGQHYTLCAQVFSIARIRQVEVYCKTFNKCVNLFYFFKKPPEQSVEVSVMSADLHVGVARLQSKFKWTKLF